MKFAKLFLSNATLVFTLATCGPGGYFISGRAEEPCVEEISACPHAGFAQCILDAKSYARRDFPGIFNFLVNADAGHEVEVVLLFAEQDDAGLLTQITWNEPGCTDSYSFNSEGLDLFAETDGGGAIKRKQEMAEDGEHLVEIESDMQALVLITVNVIAPED